ncbi:MAG: adenylosuccinate lyase [Nanoarchaeota archaeon]|nr:adenylosuccinate lyase [Nanoarchaeota archaeon]MBU1269992.1 adenylosuccinate lyase [Nanoarchaeota archaeon]MBU1604414.1 adenylosuccinate lyase [Nanoarchaeota archaeon]MBU2442590.1 adenylosuccinate lyase [Nanoarchaeota archaeon]
MGAHDVYQEPLVSRYTDKEMQHIFSDDFKFFTWRKCWTALAEAQHELGLPQVKKEMIDELIKAQKTIDYDVAGKKEKEIRHDVMAHVYEYGTHCPTAKGIIHLGATSQFVGCNTDLIQIRDALKIIKLGIINTVYNLYKFADEHKSLVTLGYTHFQPAQPTTVGKRATLYIQDLLMDLEEIIKVESSMKARGAKGTVGTQASYMELFDQDYEKVKQLDLLVSKKLGFAASFPVTGQTYTRKYDSIVAKALAGIGESAHKFAVDLRLLSNLKIMEEPFEKSQTGSSAMAYKRNPMRSERMTSLSRKLIGLQTDFSFTYANQWFERTLDDSSIRRMDIPQMFLLGNAVLKLYENITSGMVVYPAQIKKHLDEELPFMATEVILMEACKKGEDRQKMHEIIKKHSVDAGNKVKMEGKSNDLFERLAEDDEIPVSKKFLNDLLKHPERFAGAAELQTIEYLRDHVKPVIDKHKSLIGKSSSEINV